MTNRQLFHGTLEDGPRCHTPTHDDVPESSLGRARNTLRYSLTSAGVLPSTSLEMDSLSSLRRQTSQYIAANCASARANPADPPRPTRTDRPKRSQARRNAWKSRRVHSSKPCTAHSTQRTAHGARRNMQVGNLSGPALRAYQPPGRQHAYLLAQLLLFLFFLRGQRLRCMRAHPSQMTDFESAWARPALHSHSCVLCNTPLSTFSCSSRCFCSPSASAGRGTR